jgi:hypothetical protein
MSPDVFVTYLPGRSVEGDADEYEHDSKHDDADESFHGYNLPI